MKIAILAGDEQKKEWLLKPQSAKVEQLWAKDFTELVHTQADVYFDLLFQPGGERLNELLKTAAPVFINEVSHSFPDLIKNTETFSLFRLNAWPGFLKRDIVELAAHGKSKTDIVNEIFSVLGWRHKMVSDIPGLISARVIAMVINEAYYTLQEQVSTKEEIDIAMKLGTNYPFGPFEWSSIIGLNNIYQLLTKMSERDLKYQPAELLRKESEQQMPWH